jgi:hypothetical protein
MTDNAIITAAQNIAIAINGMQKTFAQSYGTANSTTYDGGLTSSITAGSGRLNNVSITVSAAATVSVHDAASTASITADNLLCVIPASTPVGTIIVNKVYSKGLVLVTGAGVSANVTYSPS